MNFSFLVIDDNELDCFLVRKIIEHYDKGITVKTFLDAREALDKIKKGRVGKTHVTILLDLQMPGLNGFQFVEEFERLPATTRKKYTVVILSSTSNATDLFRLFTYGSIHSVIEKPLTREKLVPLIVLQETRL